MMPTLFFSGPYRVAVLSRDHPPPHVHVTGPAGGAKFELGETPEAVKLVWAQGIRGAVLRRIAARIVERHVECLVKWNDVHGD